MQVKWQTIFDLPFGNTMHLHNPLNEGKPIKISRDGQEMEPAVGYELACLFDEGYSANPEQSLKRRKNVEEPEQAPKRPRGQQHMAHGGPHGARGGPNGGYGQYGGYGQNGGGAPYGGYGQGQYGCVAR